jgi:hypothetical protein
VDIDLSQAARERRAAAARLSQELASEDDLPTLLGVAQHGLGTLFDGVCTLQLAVGGQSEQTGLKWLPSDGLREDMPRRFRACQ